MAIELIGGMVVNVHDDWRIAKLTDVLNNSGIAQVAGIKDHDDIRLQRLPHGWFIDDVVRVRNKGEAGRNWR